MKTLLLLISVGFFYGASPASAANCSQNEGQAKCQPGYQQIQSPACADHCAGTTWYSEGQSDGRGYCSYREEQNSSHCLPPSPPPQHLEKEGG